MLVELYSPSIFALGAEVNRQTMLRWLSSDHQKIRSDRKQLEARARRLLHSYLTANEWQKRQYYQAIAGAASACQPGIDDPSLSNEKLAELAAQAATKVVQVRNRIAKDAHDHSAVLITDAYATVAIAYRRAASAYTADKEMEQLGTAAVHLVTIANSFMNAESVPSPTEI
ncbi:hypothetical protein IVB33_25390 [Bradyrhizobium sp. 24]|uniref:hypothetical protein n=1 Tax=unclassified Bradyrhizobium TaxID=2631580 RepID=UPI001FFBF87C|nr:MULTISPECIES: hypothetical protein [unclassified Bradyrhizobium]MCK1302742.1 hypothetical protein [Bradyrhizobium sp. 37]MCK1380498.1 hypothetical protein [Bradyrhizobium sp. 24]MCK1770903.1 hypothetical protein [Bradyrhizobium sp. 134]